MVVKVYDILFVLDDETKSNLHEDSEMHIIPGAVMTSQEPQSSSDTSAVTMQAMDSQGQLYQQQPTYVLLQTTGEQDGSGQPQVFLAMQTGGVTGQDSQVTLSYRAHEWFEILICLYVFV